MSFKTSKTLTGIETTDAINLFRANHDCFKTSKTLTGIETEAQIKKDMPIAASKHLKPLQGLKLRIFSNVNTKMFLLASKHLKPLQGLKQIKKEGTLSKVLGFKTSKTLTGIETEHRLIRD